MKSSYGVDSALRMRSRAPGCLAGDNPLIPRLGRYQEFGQRWLWCGDLPGQGESDNGYQTCPARAESRGRGEEPAGGLRVDLFRVAGLIGRERRSEQANG